MKKRDLYNKIMEDVSKVVKKAIDNDTILIPLDFSNVTEEDAKRQFINFKLIRQIPGFGSKLMQIDNPKFKINEDNMTVSLAEAQKEITTLYSLEEWQFRILHGQNNIDLCFVIPNIDDNIDMVKKDMNRLGYYESYESEEIIHDLSYTRIQFEPIYTNNVYNEIKEMGLLFHITPEYNLTSIQKQGFIPKSENSRFNYPPRVFFIKGNTPMNRVKSIARSLCVANKNKKNDGKYAILYIDTDKLPDNLRFQYDPLLDEGIFIYDKLPYDCVYYVQKYDIASD